MNITVQLCGLVLLLILLYFYYRHKRLKLDSENAFSRMMIFNIFVLLMDISSIVCIVYASKIPASLLYFFCKGYLISLVAITYIALLYATTDIYGYKKNVVQKKSLRVYTALLVLGAVAIIFLPLKYHYNILTGDLYTYGAGAMMTYAMALTFMVINIAHLWIFRTKINLRRRNAMAVWLALWVIAAIIQFFNNQILIVGFASALGCMVAYLMLENPESNIDRDTGLFNQNGLRLYLQELYGKGIKFSLVAISFEYLNSNDEKIQEVKLRDRKRLLDYLQNMQYGYVFYNLGNEVMVIFEQEEILEEVLTEMNQRFELMRREHGGDIRLRYIITKDADLLENEAQLLQYLAHCRILQKSSIEKDVLVLDSDMIDEIAEKIEVENMVENAIKENRVEVFYQPIFSLEEQRFHSAEALARIRLSHGELVGPGVFIEVAEKNGMIVQLGEQIFEQVCQFINSEAYRQLDLAYIEVNLSVIQCADEGLAEKFIHIMKKYGVSPKDINLEITESASLQAKKVLLENMRQLREFGVSFSLDDFGTGRSNLNYIAEMPVDIVKFDREMTLAYFSNERFRHVITSVVNMIDGMGMKIVLEGIEEEKQITEMERLAIDYIQGYYFSEPLAKEEFCQFILAANKK